MPGTFQAGTAKRAASCARRNAIAFTALFVALSGSAYAANEITSRDLGKKAVESKHIAKKAVRAPHIRKGSIRPPHIRKNAIRTRHVKDGGLRTADVRGLDKSVKALTDGQVTIGGYIGKLLGDVDSLKARVSELESNQIAIQKSLDGFETGLSAVKSDLAGFKTATDGRLDSLCAEADRNNEETRDLIAAIAAAGLHNLTGVDLPDFDPAECQG